jgi:hypothetical protein
MRVCGGVLNGFVGPGRPEMGWQPHSVAPSEVECEPLSHRSKPPFRWCSGRIQLI